MKLKRLVAGVLSAAMMLSIGSTLAFATSTDDTGAVLTDVSGEVSFASIMNLSSDAISAPDVTYTYTLTTGERATYTEYDADGTTAKSVLVVYPGEFSTGDDTTMTSVNTAVFSTSDYNTGTSVSKMVTFDFSAVKFSQAGEYVYIVTETITAGADKEDASLISGETVRYLYLTVVNDSTTATGYKVESAVMSETLITSNSSTEEAARVKSNSFLHSYGLSGDGNGPYTDTDDTSVNYILTDYAFGNMVNSEKPFTYSIATTGITDGTILKVSLDDGASYLYVAVSGNALYAATKNDKETVTYTYDTNNGAYTFTLTDTDTFIIYAVAEGTSFTATISDSVGDGYSVQQRVYGTDAWDSTSTLLTATAPFTANACTIAAYLETSDNKYQGTDVATVKGARDGDDEDELDDENIVYTAGFPETGVILEFAPFAIMVLAAGAFISLRAISAAKQRK